MPFSLYLKKKLQERKITRNDLIARLNLYHESFLNLDAITFSRWTTNKTTPSAYKQALIAHFFCDDLIEFMKNDLTIKKESKAVDTAFNKLMTKLEKSYSNISYFYDLDNFEYSVNVFDNQKYNEKFKLFYKRFEVYNRLHKQMNNLQVTCVIKHYNGLIASHISFFKLNSKISSLLSNVFNTEIGNDNILVNLSYIDRKDSYYFMISTLLYLLYKKSEMVFYCIIREDFLEYLTTLPCEQIGNAFIDNGFKLYILKVDLINVMVNQFVMNFFLKEIDKNEIFFNNSIRKIENHI
ncbi:TPA: hypothetical protein ACX6RR_000857 [Photobacterium damselae]